MHAEHRGGRGGVLEVETQSSGLEPADRRLIDAEHAGKSTL